jgi:hypothetical protein
MWTGYRRSDSGDGALSERIGARVTEAVGNKAVLILPNIGPLYILQKDANLFSKTSANPECGNIHKHCCEKPMPI